MTAETEGVIKDRLHFHEAQPAAPALSADLITWRWILFRLGMIGQQPHRYGGLGFGNLSRRVPGGAGFLITGTQTGGRDALTPADFSLVTETDASANAVAASGPVRPSSEALGHGAAYAVRRDIEFVFHCHHPLPWREARRLDLPQTPAAVDYGTPAMARALGELLAPPVALPRLVVMTGHEDGLIAVGRTAAEAGGLMVDTLARAMALP